MLTDYERGGTQKAEYSAEEVTSVACPLCGFDDGETLAVEHGSIGVQRCSRCELIYTSPRVHEPEAVYRGDVDRYLTEARLIFSGQASHHRDPNYREELELIERAMPAKGRFLDVGCNMGMLLRLARARGWEPTGVEPSPALYRIATEELGLKVYNCFLEELPDGEKGSFDVVALSDVFEHVTNPLEFLEAAGRFLRPGGLLYVKVPNARWNLLKQEMSRRLGRSPSRRVWDSYEHVVHYTDRTLSAMLRAGGFEPVVITTARPVQVPVWHEYVGQYYQYPSPWVLDWRRVAGRLAFHGLGKAERNLRRGGIGYCSSNLVALARCSAEPTSAGPESGPAEAVQSAS